jgi:peptidoglycan hydrolase-like protein with peptidoglycan-binding domain
MASATGVELARRAFWRRPRLILATVALLVVAMSVYLGVFGWSHGSPQGEQASSLATAVVTRADVSTEDLVAGTLGYATDVTSLKAPSAGVVESVAAAGARLRRGAVLSRIDGRPVVLLYGRRAAWRTLVAGMMGRDVRQLNANLAALGYLPAAAAGDVYDSATENAVRTLQRAKGADATGIVVLGSVVFMPGPVRIGTVPVAAGQSVEAGAQVLQMASAERVVSVDLAVASQDQVHVGNPVQIVLPDGQSTGGVVSHVARVAAVASSAGSQPDGAPTDGSGEPTVAVTIRLRNQKAAANLDQAPVQVAITTATAAGVLAVPVGSLLARGGGGYAVQVARGSDRITVAVTTGLFSDSRDLVEITAGALRAGDRVVVPG